MSEGNTMAVSCLVRVKEGLQVEVGLHQGLSLSLFLFVMVMGRLTAEVRRESPWTVIFVDDIAI